MLRWIAVGLLSTLVPLSAHATWSIAAIDPETQEVGVAVASCVEAPFGTTVLPQVPGLVPGVGALAAQAYFSQQTRDQAVQLLAQGHTPQEVVDMVVAGDFGSATRQYGVVTLDGAAAGFTGASTSAWAGDVQSFGVTAQGNILYGPEVVDDALAAFEAPAPRCPFTLADRLMAALEAGSAQGGDNRCSQEQSALAAVIMVARPDDPMDSPYLDLRIPSQPHGGDNPVMLLRVAYDQWRIAHPPDDSGCTPGTTGDGSSSDGGGDETSSTTVQGTDGGEADTGDAPPGTASPGPDGTGSADGSTTTATSGTETDSGSALTDGSSGCACRFAPRRDAAPLLALVLLAFRRRPRRADGSIAPRGTSRAHVDARPRSRPAS